jgi:hypothetical protein
MRARWPQAGQQRLFCGSFLTDEQPGSDTRNQGRNSDSYARNAQQ